MKNVNLERPFRIKLPVMVICDNHKLMNDHLHMVPTVDKGVPSDQHELHQNTVMLDPGVPEEFDLVLFPQCSNHSVKPTIISKLLHSHEQNTIFLLLYTHRLTDFIRYHLLNIWKSSSGITCLISEKEYFTQFYYCLFVCRVFNITSVQEGY